MCMVSNVGDYGRTSIPERYPWVTTTPSTTYVQSGVSREEFEALKHEVEELRDLLIAAKRFDEETGQPDCEVEDKVEFIRRLGELVGVDFSDVLPD